ncbi:MAG: MAC/perforin domain-containing protein [Bacteroidales bacterium]
MLLLIRYTSNSTVTNTVNGGFNLNLGLFSVGNKTNTKNVFTKSLVEDTNATFGELNVVVRDSVHRMQYSTAIQQKIKARYLAKDFEDELYNTHPSEFFMNYGGFVLANFVTGGKATAIFGGKYKKAESSEKKEKNMDIEISASYGFDFKGKDSNGNVSGDLKLGRGNSSSSSTSTKFESIIMSIKTVGGNSSFAAFSAPKKVENTEVNLSSWLSSLNDKDNLSVVEFGTNGLIPITDLIIERNLQNQLSAYYATGVSSYEALKEPKVTINVIMYNQPQVYVIGTELHTRFGNKILLRSKFMGHMFQPNFMQIVDDYVNAEADRMAKMFKVKITSNASNLRVHKAFGETPKTYFDFDGFNEGDLKKYTHDETIYIVSNYAITNNPSHPLYNKKFALSIHNNKTIKAYDMQAFINRLPIVDMNYEDFIQDYIIDAL